MTDTISVALTRLLEICETRPCSENAAPGDETHDVGEGADLVDLERLLFSHSAFDNPGDNPSTTRASSARLEKTAMLEEQLVNELGALFSLHDGVVIRGDNEHISTRDDPPRTFETSTDPHAHETCEDPTTVGLHTVLQEDFLRLLPDAAGEPDTTLAEDRKSHASSPTRSAENDDYVLCEPTWEEDIHARLEVTCTTTLLHYSSGPKGSGDGPLIKIVHDAVVAREEPESTAVPERLGPVGPDEDAAVCDTDSRRSNVPGESRSEELQNSRSEHPPSQPPESSNHTLKIRIPAGTSVADTTRSSSERCSRSSLSGPLMGLRRNPPREVRNRSRSATPSRAGDGSNDSMSVASSSTATSRCKPPSRRSPSSGSSTLCDNAERAVTEVTLSSIKEEEEFVSNENIGKTRRGKAKAVRYEHDVTDTPPALGPVAAAAMRHKLKGYNGNTRITYLRSGDLVVHPVYIFRLSLQGQDMPCR